MTPGTRIMTVLLAFVLGLECLLLGRQQPELNELRRRAHEHAALQARLDTEKARGAHIEAQFEQLKAQR